MARYATDLISACGRSTNQNLSGLGTDSTYTFPDDWYVSSVDSVDINQSAPYVEGQTLDVNVRFSGQGPAFSAIRNNNSNYNIVTSSNCAYHSHNGSSFKVDLNYSGMTAIEVTFDNPFNNATNLGNMIDARFTTQSANDAPNAALTSNGAVGLQITWDASGSTDPDGNDGNLQYRFDWTDNGTWDTGWLDDGGYNPHSYSSYNSKYYCRVQVKDEEGATATTRTYAYTGDDPGGGSDSQITCGGGGSDGQFQCPSPTRL